MSLYGSVNVRREVVSTLCTEEIDGGGTGWGEEGSNLIHCLSTSFTVLSISLLPMLYVLKSV